MICLRDEEWKIERDRERELSIEQHRNNSLSGVSSCKWHLQNFPRISRVE